MIDEMKEFHSAVPMHRKSYIDIMRGIGILLIIMAHVNPPHFLYNIRSFDVCMMVFVSGLAYSGRSIKFDKSFFIKRTLRLILPLWIFLSFLFLINLPFQFIPDLSTKKIVETYLLGEGIGYVWIFRVFLLIAISMPILIRINQKMKNDFLFLLMILAILMSQNFLVNCAYIVVNTLLRSVVLYALGYSALFLIGYRLPQMKRSSIIIYFLIFLLLLIGTSLSIHTMDFNNFKYPPSSIYILYGIVCSIMLYILMHRATSEGGYIRWTKYKLDILMAYLVYIRNEYPTCRCSLDDKIFGCTICFCPDRLCTV